MSKSKLFYRNKLLETFNIVKYSIDNSVCYCRFSAYNRQFEHVYIYMLFGTKELNIYYIKISHSYFYDKSDSILNIPYSFKFHIF